MNDFWSILHRHLGARSEAVLHPVSFDGKEGPPAVIRAGEGNAFLLLHAEGRPLPTLSCLLRLSPVTLETAAKVRQEAEDLSSGALPGEGTTRPAGEFATSGADRVVLPPLYFCRQKGKWIGVVCPGCSGIPSNLGESDANSCETCGSANTGGDSAGSDMNSPMEALWTAIQESPGPAVPPAPETVNGDRIPKPYCLRCERKMTCFSPAGSRLEPRGALDALIPLMETPWAGSLVAGFDLPLAAWLKLAKDPGIDLASIAPETPRAVRDEIATAAQDQHGRLVPAEFREGRAGQVLFAGAIIMEP